MGSANFATYQVTVATATATDLLAAIRTLLGLLHMRVEKIQVKERDDTTGDGATVFRIAGTAAAATTAAPAAGVAAVGPVTYSGGMSQAIDILHYSSGFFLYHAAGANRTFSVMIWW